MQCSNWFSWDHVKYSAAMGPACPANGNGKACVKMETTRAKMNDYMKSLARYGIGYVSLKQKYMSSYPVLQVGRQEGSDMEERPPGEGDEDGGEEPLTTILMPPVMERDLKIKALEKEIENITALKEELNKAKANAKIEKRKRNVMEKKCDQVKQLAEKQVAEAIKGDFGFLVSNPEVVTLLTLNIDKEIFELDETADEVKAKNEKDFLKEITENIESFVASLARGEVFTWLKVAVIQFNVLP